MMYKDKGIKEYVIQFIDCKIKMVVSTKEIEVIEYTKKILRVPFQIKEIENNQEEEFDYIVNVYDYENSYKGECTERIIVRETKFKLFHMEAYTDVKKKKFDFIDKQTELRIETNEYFIGITEYSSLILIDLIRGLMYKLAEKKGALVVHSSAIYDVSNEGGIIVTGRKGAGKTTTLFRYLCKGGNKYLSGDKSFIRIQNNDVLLYGFPDFPTIGVGAIINNEKLLQYCRERNIDLNKEGSYKVLFDLDDLTDALGVKYRVNSCYLKRVEFANVNKNVDIDIDIFKYQNNYLFKNVENYNDSQYSKWLGKIQEIDLMKKKQTEEILMDKLKNGEIIVQ